MPLPCALSRLRFARAVPRDALCDERHVQDLRERTRDLVCLVVATGRAASAMQRHCDQRVEAARGVADAARDQQPERAPERACAVILQLMQIVVERRHIE